MTTCATWTWMRDEMARFLASDTGSCPFWRPGGDYLTARKQ